jgi:peptide/nickel transport system ATP-binding protein
MECGPTDRVVDSPEHPYTKGLVDCRITADSSHPLSTIRGSAPDQVPDTGCPFASRCEYETIDCRESEPPTVSAGSDHVVSCGELDSVRRSEPTRRGDADEKAVEISNSKPQVQTCYDGGRIQERSEYAAAEGTAGRPLFEARSITKQFDCSASVFDRWLGESRTLTAVDSVDLAVGRGETVGIVGESGSGKSTLAELLTGLQTPTDGKVLFDGEPVNGVETRSCEQLQTVGVVFQSPQDSINPRLTVREAVAEPLLEAGWSHADRIARADELLDLVELGRQYASRRPHQLSGGQLQRVAIARAIALEPQVVVFDEPVSALDLSTRAKLLNLLVGIQERLDLTYLVISHDLGVVKLIADRVAVMYDGRVVERGHPDRIFDQPAHSHTAALVAAATSNE